MKLDGTPVGQVKSLRTRSSEDVKEAMQGEEIAVAVQGPPWGATSRSWTNLASTPLSANGKRLKKADLRLLKKRFLQRSWRFTGKTTISGAVRRPVQ